MEKVKHAYVIGLGGGSGSGKTTFAEMLIQYFPNKIACINCDNYYLPHDDLSLVERNKLNYDDPSAIDIDLLVSHLKLLKEGVDVESPVYDFARHTRSNRTKTIECRPIIIIDGIMIYTDLQLRNMIDFKIYMDTDADERILRRLKRDIEERGRTLDSVIDQYKTSVKPMYEMHIAPTKACADIIIQDSLCSGAFDIVKTKIESLIRDNLQEENNHVNI